MNKLFKIVLILAVAAVVFFAGYVCASLKYGRNSSQAIAVEVLDYSEDILGDWSPVDVAKGKLSFKYGVLHHHTQAEFGGGYVEREYPFSVKGTHLYLENRYPGIHGIKGTLDLPMNIYEEDGVKYLEIRDVPGFYGKYKKTK